MFKHFTIFILVSVLLLGCQEHNLPNANFNLPMIENLQCESGDASVSLSWDESSKRVPTGFYVSWLSGDSSIIVKDNSILIDSLTNGIEYTFSVQALYGSDGRSGAQEVKCKPVSSRFDATNYSVQAGNEEILVKWTPPSSPKLLGYMLEVNPGGKQIQISSPETNRVLVDNLQNDQEYTVTLFSKYSKGLSEGLTDKATPGFISPISVSDTFLIKGNKIDFSYNPLFFLKDIKSVKWDFGDNHTSNQESPNHEYDNIGKFTVDLTVNFEDNTNEKKSINIYVTGIKWHTPVNDGKVGEIKASSPAIGIDGSVYINAANSGSGVYAFNPDGTIKWHSTSPTKGFYGGGPVVNDNTVYSACEDGILYAFNSNDGSVKWQFDTDNFMRCFPAVGADGSIYIGTSKGSEKLYAINSSGGEEWNFDLDAACGAIGVGSDGTIYVGTTKTLFALNPDGTEKWSQPVSTTKMGGVAIQGNRIYVGGSGSTGLYAFSTSGEFLWTFPVSGDTYSPSISTDGTIYISSKSGVLYSVNPNGSEKWHLELDARTIYTSPTIDKNGVIYIGCDRGGADKSGVFAINPDGTLKWKVERGEAAQSFSTPAISDDGMLYIGDIGNSNKPGGIAAIPIYTSPANNTWFTRSANSSRTNRE